jgi:hypothetical protein
MEWKQQERPPHLLIGYCRSAVQQPLGQRALPHSCAAIGFLALWYPPKDWLFSFEFAMLALRLTMRLSSC